jgi:hypothetical protein
MWEQPSSRRWEDDVSPRTAPDREGVATANGGSTRCWILEAWIFR